MSAGARRALLAAALMLCTAGTAAAQEDEAQAGPVQDETAGAPAARVDMTDASRGRTLARFLAGGAAGLGLHEGGHLLFDMALGAGAGVRGVSFGPVPFFAITHRDVSPAREFTISAAGFWMQHASTEWLLARRPRLNEERAPAMKGLLAFNLLASGAYGVAALGRFGPAERDTRGMARELRIDEAWVGVMVLAPAALDTWRYLRPESAAARWSSRAAKLAMVLLVVRAASRH